MDSARQVAHGARFGLGLLKAQHAVAVRTRNIVRSTKGGYAVFAVADEAPQEPAAF